MRSNSESPVIDFPKKLLENPIIFLRLEERDHKMEAQMEWHGSDHAISQFYPGVSVALVTLLTYPVSTCTAERSFSSMKRLKSPLRSTMTSYT